MIRKSLLLALSLAFLPVCVTAQDTSDTRAALKEARAAYREARKADRYRPDDRLMSVRAFAAGTAGDLAWNFYDGGRLSWIPICCPDYTISDIYSDYFSAISVSGTYGLEFDYSLGKRLSLSASFGIASVWGDLKNPVTGKITGRETGTAFALIPRIKYMYRNTPTLRMYSCLGIGIRSCVGFDRMEGSAVSVCGDFCIFGVEYGRRLFVSAELGASGVAGSKLGIGYRF